MIVCGLVRELLVWHAWNLVVRQAGRQAYMVGVPPVFFMIPYYHHYYYYFKGTIALELIADEILK